MRAIALRGTSCSRAPSACLYVGSLAWSKCLLRPPALKHSPTSPEPLCCARRPTQGGPSKLATHLGAMLGERKDEVVQAVLNAADGVPPTAPMPPALDISYGPAAGSTGPLGVRFTHECG